MELIMCVRLHQLAVFFILALVPLSLAQVKNSCRTSSLPSAAQALLDRKYGDWRPKAISDLGADDREFWVEAHPRDCPGIALGHFEEPDRLAYAVLLVPKSELNHGYKMIVLSKLPTGDTYAARLLDQADGEYSNSGLAISTAPRGSYSDFEDTTSVRLRLDAVNAEWIGKGAVLYYWMHGKYQTLQTSD